MAARKAWPSKSAGSRDAAAGTSVNETKLDRMTAAASTRPNSRNSLPAVLGRNAIGTNTEISTAVVVMTAKKTCRVPSTAAARAPRPCARLRLMFSSTTMASSTTMPVARTSASSVRMLIENPSIQIAATVPISATGIATLGTSVARIEPMKTQMVAMTIDMVSDNVISTSRTELRMKIAWSSVITMSRLSKRSLSRSTARCTPSEIWIVLDFACRTTDTPMTGLPSRRVSACASSGPKYTLAISPTRIGSRTMMLATSSAVTTDASARTMSSWSCERKLPAGTSNGAVRRTRDTSVTDRP